ncbi:hypothetical protein RJ639_032597 [Escallonia herrerae]|uniref:Late embryogenesis abundant protein LEA-2 subgroup domain-containing protein n=1 Tax=Escallonia herrerae TaxID=1293975 RepID=A0AA88X3C0_9ASTE|nr:hypothetical protein RJ639_032597 [Escallonia herrerae]
MAARDQGTVIFRLDLTSTIRFKISTWDSKRHRMHSNCQVGVGKDGLILANYKDKRCPTLAKQKMIRRRLSESRFALCWSFFQVLTVLSLVSVVIWQSLIPKCPTFTITDLHVPALGSQNSTLEHDEVIRNTSVIINLEISKPNKRMGIYYDDIYVTFYYDRLLEGNGSIPAFSQGRKRITSRKVLVRNSNATTGVNQGQNGTLSFNLEIQNPNKDSSIYYEDILLTLFYNEDNVGQKTILRFHQGKDRTTQIVDQMDASARVHNMLPINMSNKTAELKAGLATRIQYQTWGVKSQHHRMNMQGLVKIGSDGKISGKKKIKLHHVSGKSRMKLT